MKRGCGRIIGSAASMAAALMLFQSTAARAQSSAPMQRPLQSRCLVFDDAFLFNPQKLPGWAVDPPVPPSPGLVGDELIFSADMPVVVARGNIVFRYSGYVILADEFSLDQPHGRLTIRGNAELREPGDRTTLGDSIVLTEELRDGFEYFLTCATHSFRVERGKLPEASRPLDK